MELPSRPPVGLAAYQYVLPILTCEVLICRLAYTIVEDVRLPTKHYGYRG